MRTAFAAWLADRADTDDRVRLLTGDLGFQVFDGFAERHPDRFLNVGVAEQNMVGIATGLGEAGFVPFVYSIATFASMRAYEFIRNGPLLHRLPVRVVGVGAGFDYGHNGMTHFALEDVAIMRAQPGMTVVAPADRAQTRAALDAIAELPGPVYLRLGKGGEEVAELEGRFELGRSITLREGEVMLVALGSMAGEALAAADLLASAGVAAGVTVVSSFTAEPDPELDRVLDSASVAVAVEAAYVNGGLGSCLAERIAESGSRCRLVRCGVRTMPHGLSGSLDFLNDVAGISARKVADEALRGVALAAD
ncbi:MAG TPA: transketolase C-terminal domain-containing protein [Solirubrobacterales bacterium]|nr:transketolase C-terminal domain-containing protein [Solirubrobacterales bacterium]